MHEPIFFVKKGGKSQRVRLNHIIYIKAKGSYLVLVTVDRKFYITQNLSQFLHKNNIPSFVRVHRSYIVNIDIVDSFDQKYIYIKRRKIPLSSTYKENFLKCIHCI